MSEQHVYEVVENSCDEMYFPEGIFLSLEEAEKAITEADPERAITDSGHDSGDIETLTIIERRVGMSGHGIHLVSYERENVYVEEFDELRWVCRKLEKAR